MSPLDIVAPYQAEHELRVSQSPRDRSHAGEGPRGTYHEISEWWSLEEQPADYYRAAAARARRLQAEATTPRLKQYLRELIVECERLAGKVASASQKNRVDQPGLRSAEAQAGVRSSVKVLLQHPLRPECRRF